MQLGLLYQRTGRKGQSMHVVISGGTGFVGRVLVPRLLDAGHQVSVVTRSPDKVRALYDGRAGGVTLDALPGRFDAAINLAGETVALRWTARRKREIRDSRVNVTAALRIASEAAGAHSLVSASAVGFYGDTGDNPRDETSGPGTGFLADTCMEWEAAAQSTKLRVTLVRLGFVIGRGGPGINKMALPFKLFVGGPVAGGRQFIAWVHVDDVAGIFQWALENQQVSGVVNAMAPVPVTNREFSKALARALRRPCWAPVPGFMVRLLFGEMSRVILESQRALPTRTLALGYTFQRPDLLPALNDCFQR